MEHEGSSLWPQEPINCPYPEPDASNVNPPTLFPLGPF
jgi:hypothetical protein